MPKLQRTSLLTVAAFGAVGGAAGLLTQMVRSTYGRAPFVPPISLAATLVVIGAVVLTLGILLRRSTSRNDRGNVDPFQAVRLLAAARASIFAGTLFAGFGAGLALHLLGRSVPAQPSIWVPMLLAIAGGVTLAVCGAITEILCRVPPEDPEIEEAALG